MLIGKAAGRQCRPHLELRHAGIFLPDFLNGGIVVAPVGLLLKIAGTDKLTQLDFSGNRLDLPQQGFQQGGLAQAVHAPEGHLPAPLQLQVHRIGQGRIVAQHKPLRLNHEAAWRAVHLKMEVRLRLFRALFQKLHLVQPLLTGICHATGSHPGLVTLDKILFLGNLRLLALIGGILLPPLDGIHLLKLLIAAGIACQGGIFHMINHVGNSIEERHIMRYQDKSIFVALQVILQPLDMLHIQEVGWLIQDEDIRALQQQLRQQHLGALAA